MVKRNVEYLVADTTAFIQNAPLQNVGQHIITCQEVVDEITNKRQLRRLIVLPYDLAIKNVYPENVKLVTEFSKQTGDYQSLSATDIKVIALTYQLEKEHVGVEHLRTEPVMQRTVNITSKKEKCDETNVNVSGFYKPQKEKQHPLSAVTESQQENEQSKTNVYLEESFEELSTKFKPLEYEDPIAEKDESNLNNKMSVKDVENILMSVEDGFESDEEQADVSEDDSDDIGWITPSNIETAKTQLSSGLMEEKQVKVACMTTDFAMQNVLRQINLNVAALDGRMIKQLRTFILRCYTCFCTTSIMTKLFCPKCGNKTLKRVAVSLDENGKQQIHINGSRPLTGRGKKFSLPRIQGGKHSNNPLLVEDQPIPDQRTTRLASTKNNPMEDDYIAGYSPFIMRDVTSKSAQLKIRPATEVKHWMRKNPNEAVRRRKK